MTKHRTGNDVFDTAVIGTGIGGLTAGLKLARQGRRVLLLEAGKQFGGMLNPFGRGKYHFDIGVHYVGQAGPDQGLRRRLDRLGLESLEFEEMDPECIDRYVFGGYEGRFVKGLDAWSEALIRDFPAERDGIRKMAGLIEVSRAMMQLGTQGVTPGRVLRSLRYPGWIWRLLTKPYAEILNRCVRDPMLRNVYAGMAGNLGLPPSRVSGLMFLLLHNHYLDGGYYPVGGGGGMRDAFVTGLREHDAKLVRNAEVMQIARHDVSGNFLLTTARGEVFESRTVVSNVDAQHTMALLDPALVPARWAAKRAATLRPSLSSLCVYVATTMDLPKYGFSSANIWHYGDQSVEEAFAPALATDAASADAAERARRVPPPVFMTAPTLKCPSMQTVPGHHTLELITLCHAGPFRRWFDGKLKRRGEDYEALKAERAEQLLDTVEEHYLPGLRQNMVAHDASTPATVWTFVRGREGGIYGPEQTPDQVLLGRFRPDFGVPGLALAGASVMAGGVMPCLDSGLWAAKVVGKALPGRGVRGGRGRGAPGRGGGAVVAMDGAAGAAASSGVGGGSGSGSDVSSDVAKRVA